MGYGKAIELFLVNGTADSLTTAELSNWNGKAIKIPRIELPDCSREDINQPGVYFLFCKEDDDTDSVYIGESENVRDRLMQHLRDYQSDKETYYWNTAIIFTGRDLNKASIRYLENGLVEIAKNSGRYNVLTKNTYKNTVMKESQEAVMEEFIDNVKILIGALGYKVLEPLVKQNSTVSEESAESILYLTRRGTNSKGKRVSDGFVLLKGSKIALDEVDSCADSIKEKRQLAFAEGKVVNAEGIIQEDILFNTPSGAAAFAIGGSANGLIEWRNENKVTLKEIEQAEVK